MTEDIKPKPCPFCGAILELTANERDDGLVYVHPEKYALQCVIFSVQVDYYDVEKWNRRCNHQTLNPLQTKES